MTTSRKFFTVLFSVIFYLNPLTRLQWFAIVLVFLALLADAYLGRIRLPCLRESDPLKLHGAVQSADVKNGKGAQGETQDEKQVEPEQKEKMLEITKTSNETATPLEKSIESAV